MIWTARRSAEHAMLFGLLKYDLECAQRAAPTPPRSQPRVIRGRWRFARSRNYDDGGGAQRRIRKTPADRTAFRMRCATRAAGRGIGTERCGLRRCKPGTGTWRGSQLEVLLFSGASSDPIAYKQSWIFPLGMTSGMTTNGNGILINFMKLILKIPI